MYKISQHIILLNPVSYIKISMFYLFNEKLNSL